MTELRPPAPETAYAAPPPEFPATLPLPRRDPLEARPRTVGRHGVVGVLGEGGMGSVLAVVDPVLGRETAAKVIRGAADGPARDMFLREALITAQLEHPGIVPLYDVGEIEPGTPYFTMRKIVGTDLETRLATAPPLAEVLPIFLKVCEAVAFAHSRKILHRDLKPANIMTGAFGEVYVCDWGLAKRIGEAESVRPDSERAPEAGRELGHPHTLDGTILGTPGYMPPEQAAGRIHELDETSDVFSLGAVLYHVLTGVAPYSGATVWDALEQACAAEAVPPSARAPERAIPWELEVISAKAMARARENRYPSVLAMKADVEAYLGGRLVGAAHYGALAATRKWLARNPALWRSALVLVVVALSTLVWRWREHRQAVEVAFAAVRAAEPARWVAAARAVRLDDDPLARARPDARELSRLGESIAALQEASRALGELARLSPEDANVLTWRYYVLTSLGRLAEVRGEDALAELAYAQAATLGVDDTAARDLSTAAIRAKDALLVDRKRRIRARLDEARAGKLAGERAMSEAVLELASFRERQTVDDLTVFLDACSSALIEAACAILVETDPENAQALRCAGKRLLDPAYPPPTREESSLLALACDRLARGTNTDVVQKRTGHERLGDRQIAALGEGDPQRALELACVVLGLLGDVEGTTPPLVRLIHAHADERRAVPAGLALAHLARRSPPALAALFAVASRDPLKDRYFFGGPFWSDLRPVLLRAGLRAPDGESAVAEGSSEEAVEPQVYIARAMAREALGDFVGASAVYAKALARYPRNTTLLLNAGTVRFSAGDYAGAIEAYTHALELDPGDTDVLSNRGAARRAAGDLEGALLDLSRALELKPTLAAAFNNRGNLHQQLGNLDSALADFDRALELDPRYVEARSNRGKLYLDRGQLALAEADCDYLLTVNPRYVPAYFERARIRFTMARWDECIADATRAIELAPGDHEAYVLRGGAQAKRGNREGMYADYAKVVQWAPEHPDAHYCQAAIHLARGETAEAVTAITRAIELSPRHPLYYNMRGRARVAAGDPRGALPDFDRAIELAPEAGGHFLGRGYAKYWLRDWEGSIADSTKAADLNPRDPEPLINRGLAREEQGDHAAAIADFTRAIALNGSMAAAFYDRAISRQGQGDKLGAIEDYDRAIELDARNPSFFVNRGYLLYELGELARAIADLRRAIDLDPRGWRGHFALGMALVKSGSPADALPAFVRARELVTDETTRKQIDVWIDTARR